MIADVVRDLLMAGIIVAEVALVRELRQARQDAKKQHGEMLGAFGAHMGLNVLVALAQAWGIKTLSKKEGA